MSRNIEFSDEELRVLLAALVTVSPSTCASAQYKLYRRLSDNLQQECDARLVSIMSKTIIDEWNAFNEASHSEIDPFTRRPVFDRRDAILLNERKRRWAERIDGPRVGDFVEMTDGTLRRFTYSWNDGIQVTNAQYGSSFYLSKHGYADFSGGLDPAIPITQLVDTQRVRDGSFWFFHHDVSGANRGVECTMECRIYRHDTSRPAFEIWTMVGKKRTYDAYVNYDPHNPKHYVMVVEPNHVAKTFEPVQDFHGIDAIDVARQFILHWRADADKKELGAEQ
jgi:hypothetical protein